METFFALLALCVGNSPALVNFPHCLPFSPSLCVLHNEITVKRSPDYPISSNRCIQCLHWAPSLQNLKRDPLQSAKLKVKAPTCKSTSSPFSQVKPYINKGTESVIHNEVSITGESGKLLHTSLDDVEAISGQIPGFRPASERRRYKVTPCLIGWAQT